MFIFFGPAPVDMVKYPHDFFGFHTVFGGWMPDFWSINSKLKLLDTWIIHGNWAVLSAGFTGGWFASDLQRSETVGF